jgi:hypothetical protein
VFSRFSDKAALLLIGTRWHIDDPAGRMIEHFGDRVQIARFSALAEHDEAHRKMGESLFPELKSLEFLLERKKLYTIGSWEALYQQNPIVVGGGVFPIERIQVRPIQPDRSQILRSVRFVDKAGTSDGGAYTAMVLMHLMHDKSYVIEHVARGQWSSARARGAVSSSGPSRIARYSRLRTKLASSRSRQRRQRKCRE